MKPDRAGNTTKGMRGGTSKTELLALFDELVSNGSAASLVAAPDADVGLPLSDDDLLAFHGEALIEMLDLRLWRVGREAQKLQRAGDPDAAMLLKRFRILLSAYEIACSALRESNRAVRDGST